MNWLHSICLTRMDCRSACCSAWAITVASLGPSSWRPGDVPELVPVEGGGALREVKLARLAGEGVVQVADLAGVVAADLDERKEVLIGGVEAGEDLVSRDTDGGRSFDAPLDLDEEQLAAGIDGADVKAGVGVRHRLGTPPELSLHLEHGAHCPLLDDPSFSGEMAGGGCIGVAERGEEARGNDECGTDEDGGQGLESAFFFELGEAASQATGELVRAGLGAFGVHLRLAALGGLFLEHGRALVPVVDLPGEPGPYRRDGALGALVDPGAHLGEVVGAGGAVVEVRRPSARRAVAVAIDAHELEALGHDVVGASRACGYR